MYCKIYENPDEMIINCCKPVLTKGQEIEEITLPYLSSVDMADILITAYEADTIIGFMEVYDLYAEAEVKALVTPSARSTGCFNMMLDTLKGNYDFDKITFLSDGSSNSTASILSSRNYEIYNSEYILSKDIDALADSKISIFKTAPDKSFLGYIKAIFHPEMSEEQLLEIYRDSLSGDNNKCIYLESEKEKIGIGVITCLGSSALLSFFGIKDTYRGKGFGLNGIKAIENYLSDTNTKLSVQVSGDNLAAIALYKKAGFNVDQYLEYIV